MYYLILFISLLILINFYFKIANYFKIIDIPNERSSHSKITIRGGGIIFLIGALVYFFVSRFQYPWFLLGLFMIGIISFIDDIKTASIRIRFTVQFLAVLLLVYQLDLLAFPWWIILATLILTIAIINAYNFMDGINGITGGYSLAVLLGLWIVNNYTIVFIENKFIYSIAIALIVFNLYNFRHKAKCFAGDVGSLSIAFILIFLLGKLILCSGNLIYLFFLVLYGVDSVLTLIHRIYLKENILKPHRQHIYQILANEAGYSHLQVAIGYTLIQTIINFMIIGLNERISFSYLVIIISGLLIALIFIYVRIKKKYSFIYIKP